ncbi:MAG: sugar transferase [Planctomycetota bacterium]
MFQWISRPLWTRNLSWTPLILSQREFQRCLAKERARVDRNGNSFGVIVLRLESTDDIRGKTIQLGKLLHRRLRETDEKGHLSRESIAVLLPETSLKNTAVVFNNILELARRDVGSVDGEYFSYPEPRNHQDDDSHSGEPRAEEESIGSEMEEPVGDSLVADSTKSIAFSPQIKEHSMIECVLPAYPMWKRAIDVAGASLGLLLVAPLLMLAAIAIKLTSRGPVFFCQQRTGYLGRSFTIYKLRTMVVNAEAMQSGLSEGNERDGPAFKMRGDPRVTLVGKFLRATGLDELPQLINVLVGDMSLVGPRPLPVAEAAQCKDWQSRRMLVRPGLTCTWQINKCEQISFIDWMRMDISYTRRFNFGWDIRIIFQTVWSVLRGRVGH